MPQWQQGVNGCAAQHNHQRRSGERPDAGSRSPRFKPDQVKELIQECLNEKLTGQKYHVDKVGFQGSHHFSSSSSRRHTRHAPGQSIPLCISMPNPAHAPRPHRLPNLRGKSRTSSSRSSKVSRPRPPAPPQPSLRRTVLTLATLQSSGGLATSTLCSASSASSAGRG